MDRGGKAMMAKVTKGARVRRKYARDPTTRAELFILRRIHAVGK